MRWAGHVARTENKRSAYRVLVGRPEGKRPLGKTLAHRRDDIKIDLKDMLF
jgi:hypothetical protein